MCTFHSLLRPLNCCFHAVLVYLIPKLQLPEGLWAQWITKSRSHTKGPMRFQQLPSKLPRLARPRRVDSALGLLFCSSFRALPVTHLFPRGSSFAPEDARWSWGLPAAPTSSARTLWAPQRLGKSTNPASPLPASLWMRNNQAKTRLFKTGKRFHIFNNSLSTYTTKHRGSEWRPGGGNCLPSALSKLNEMEGERRGDFLMGRNKLNLYEL